MYGAILGDIVGSPYEFDCNNYKAKDFLLFSRRSDFTDDTVMTLAVAKALLSSRGQDDTAIKAALVREMQQLGRAYPDRGYGTHFGDWLYEDAPQPYQSYGNGSAMRVSPAAWLATDMAETLRLARLTAQVTHDHPRASRAPRPPPRPFFSPARVTTKRRSKRMWSANSATTQPNLRRNSSHLPSCRELSGNRAAGNHRVFGESRF
ncbi:MAG: ADP-ribosylglycohydrolase family protein [Oscillospiraceae bacterium]